MCASHLPFILYVLTEGIHILDFELCAVIKGYITVPKTVHLVGVHSADNEVCIGVVVVGGSHCEVESAIL